jgi:hypothetical protein
MDLVQSSERIFCGEDDRQLHHHHLFCVGAGKTGDKLTYNKINVFRVCVSFKFERKLVEVPYPHLGFVYAGCHYMVSVAGGFYFVAGFGELESLDELNGSLDMLLDGAFSFRRRALPCEPVWERGGRAGRCSVDSVDLDCRHFF